MHLQAASSDVSLEKLDKSRCNDDMLDTASPLPHSQADVWRRRCESAWIMCGATSAICPRSTRAITSETISKGWYRIP